jgi:ribosomal protein S27E
MMLITLVQLRNRDEISMGFFSRSRQPSPGKWYLAVTCGNCQCKIVLFADFSSGNCLLEASMMVRCPDCGHEASYTVERYQHHTEQAAYHL